MSRIVEFSMSTWNTDAAPHERDAAVDALESGNVVFIRDLAFELRPGEERLLRPEVVSGAKNVSLAPTRAELRGHDADPTDAALMQAMMARFAAWSEALVNKLIPHYGEALESGRTSYRPAEIAGRQMSWRKDDTRLHVDSFPASPVHGRRILRVFANINPGAKARTWRVGEPFEDVARRFVPAIPKPRPGVSAALQLLHVTKSRRTPYDHYMLNLHDAMKADGDYQAHAAQAAFDFPPGTTWLVYTDQVSHAAMGGQYALEQTFYLPVSAMQYPERSPLRVLERLLERPLT